MLSDHIKKLPIEEVDLKLLELGIPHDFWKGFRTPMPHQKRMLLFQLLVKRTMLFAEPRVGKTQPVMDMFRFLNMFKNVKRCMFVTDNETACVSLLKEYTNYGLKPVMVLTAESSKLNVLIADNNVIICSYRTLFASTLFGVITLKNNKSKTYEIDYEKLQYFVKRF